MIENNVVTGRNEAIFFMILTIEMETGRFPESLVCIIIIVRISRL